MTDEAKSISPSTEQAAAESEPKQEWKRLIDMPTDTLASRVVGSMILAKGNLNAYQEIIKNLLDSMATEHAADAGAEAVDERKACAELVKTLPLDLCEGTYNRIEDRALIRSTEAGFRSAISAAILARGEPPKTGPV